jgi:hypothetical protein
VFLRAELHDNHPPINHCSKDPRIQHGLRNITLFDGSRKLEHAGDNAVPEIQPDCDWTMYEISICTTDDRTVSEEQHCIDGAMSCTL